ncbi:hypothetical protein [Desulfovibrio sp. Huiquan2017]|uniref:hypothetical protein n=1 Tax=Desulfovibrio sp. Huiquan2017 TaxID=2816861 RepID=UPI001A913FD8|nr:hypothetical protein [Desulfovibrio sp. Huiquan2017]
MKDYRYVTAAEIAENGGKKLFEADGWTIVVERDGDIWCAYDMDGNLALVVPGNRTLSDVKFFVTQVQLYVSKRLGAVA